MFDSGRRHQQQQQQQPCTPRPIDATSRGYGQANDRPCRDAPAGTGLVLNGTKASRVSSNEKRRARQDAYRQELDVQVAEDRERRKLEAQKIRDVEERHELKSVRTVSLSAKMYRMYRFVQKFKDRLCMHVNIQTVIIFTPRTACGIIQTRRKSNVQVSISW